MIYVKEATILKEPIALNAPKIALIAIKHNVMNAKRIFTQLEKLVQHVQKFVSNVMVQQQMIAEAVILATIFLGTKAKFHA